jgi:hypothetical protein
VASGPDEAGTCQHCQMVRARRAWRKGIREEPAFTPLKITPARTWRIGVGGDAHPMPAIFRWWVGELPEAFRLVEGRLR